MGHKTWFIEILLLYFLPLNITLQGQWCELQKSSGSSEVDTLYFGNNPLATYGIDSLSPTFVEYELPPLPFCSFVRWVNLPHRFEMGHGLKMDIRGIPEAPLHKDTFALLIGDWSTGMYNMLVLRWSDSLYLSGRCDSMFLKDVRWGIPTVDMMSNDSLSISVPPGGREYKFYIFKYGVKMADTEPPPASSIFQITASMENSTQLYVNTSSSPPEFYSLSQNYPNPFNPSTTIRFDLPEAAFVTVKIYNVLGEEIETLVNDTRPAGRYVETWSGGYNPSGIYYYKLRAGKYSETRRMIFVR